MINFKLDDNEAWFLTQILDNALVNYDLFITVDENDEETFDENFYEEIMILRKRLIEIRSK
jgi:hypothetical protein